MLKTIVPFEKVSQLSKTDVAYATGDPVLRPFYKYERKHEAFKQIIEDKSREKIPREILVEVLRKQYADLPKINAVSQNIESLLQSTTFTVVTAHQPCLFLGPMYFMYKALTTINLAGAASGLVRGDYKIVPVFVLGSEDHDLEEMNHASLFGKEVKWQPDQKGAVGSFSTTQMEEVLEQCHKILGDAEHARYIFSRLENAYDGQKNFAEATQILLHDLLGQYGLVVINMNEKPLKKLFSPIIKAELTEQKAFELVNETTQKLNDLGFKTQAAPREINLFYMIPGLRERIVFEPVRPGQPGGNEKYKVLNTDLSFSKTEILEEVDNFPERFSPNVVLRPLFQEMILPNLAYVGGGGELAYWLERKTLFEHFGINFPLLIRRNSVLLIDRENTRKLSRFGISSARIFEDADAIIRFFIEQHAEVEVSLNTEIGDLQKIFDKIALKARTLDPTLENSVRADETRFLQGLEQWESRLMRAEKAKHEVTINQIRSLKNRLFPDGGLQERVENFLPWYLKYGESLFNQLKDKLLPLERGVVVLEEK